MWKTSSAASGAGLICGKAVGHLPLGTVTWLSRQPRAYPQTLTIKPGDCPHSPIRLEAHSALDRYIEERPAHANFFGSGMRSRGMRRGQRTISCWRSLLQDRLPGDHDTSRIRRSPSPSGSFLTTHLLSKIIVARFSAVNAGQFGKPLWLGLPRRAKLTQA